MTFLLHSLSERYSPLGEETRIKANHDLLNFAAELREKIDDLLIRFDIVRHRAETEGDLAMNVHTITEILLKACRLNADQLMRLLEPTNGLPPGTQPNGDTFNCSPAPGAADKNNVNHKRLG